SSTSPVGTGDTRNYTDGTSSSECELRRNVRNDRGCALRLSLFVKWHRRQPVYGARSSSAAEYACDPARPSATLLPRRPAARDAKRCKSTCNVDCRTSHGIGDTNSVRSDTYLDPIWGRGSASDAGDCPSRPRGATTAATSGNRK